MGVSRLRPTGDCTVYLLSSMVVGVLYSPSYVRSILPLREADSQLMILVDPCLRNVGVLMLTWSALIGRVQKQHGPVGRCSAAKRYIVAHKKTLTASQHLRQLSTNICLI